MKRKIIFTVLWMLGFAGLVTACYLAALAVMLRTAHEVGTVIYTQVVVGSLVVISPLVALLLGLRGALPGTKKPHVTNAA